MQTKLSGPSCPGLWAGAGLAAAPAGWAAALHKGHVAGLLRDQGGGMRNEAAPNSTLDNGALTPQDSVDAARRGGRRKRGHERHRHRQRPQHRHAQVVAEALRGADGERWGEALSQCWGTRSSSRSAAPQQPTHSSRGPAIAITFQASQGTTRWLTMPSQAAPIARILARQSACCCTASGSTANGSIKNKCCASSRCSAALSSASVRPFFGEK